MISIKRVGVVISLIILISIFSVGVLGADECASSPGTLSVQSECQTDADCDDGDPCTLDECRCTTYCKHTIMDSLEPDTNVLYTTKDNGQEREDCEDGWMYVNFEYDDVVVNFYSEDICSNLKNVEYTRTGWNTYWEQGGGFIGSDESKEDEWNSDPDDEWTEEQYKVCGRAKDMSGNQENDGLDVEDVPDDDCCMLCIDKDEPDQVGNIIHSNPGNCVSNYINEAPEFTWNEASDTGCAGIDYYEVEVYYSDGSIYYAVTTTQTTITINNPANGEDYYIKVKAVDKAGNEGAWSEKSEDVYYDTEAPVVEITTPADEWMTGNFSVSETDTDNLGLYKCYYRIWNDGDFTLDWTETACNEDVYIDVDAYCPVDGLNNCWVYKKAVDKACNEEVRWKEFDIDTTPPVVDKIVGAPKYPGFGWLQWIIDLFITDETEIAITCEDEASGVQAIYYKINDGNFTEYSAPFTLSPDGVYYIEYYCVDNVDKESEHKNETDKVDTEAPVTTKEYIGSRYPLEGYPEWINSETLINLTAEDSEVGVGEIRYRVSGVLAGKFCNECEDWMTSLRPDIGPWNTYETPFNILEDSCHVIEYRSIDLLENQEEIKWQCISVDNIPPTIEIINPTLEEAENIEKCVQSIVVKVEDEKSGVNESSIYAELYYENGTAVPNHKLQLIKTVYRTYEALMDKQLPAGEYTLIVYAEDNLGNIREERITENLAETVFVEHITPATCEIDPETGGECEFTYHICIRGENGIKMWMNKLGELVTPGMMDAKVSKDDYYAYVGLKHDGFESPAGFLQLTPDCEKINGRTEFNLHLDVDSEVAGSIGQGVHDLEYWIRSSSDECNPDCTDADGDGFAIEGGLCGEIDCKDDDSSINPNVTETCDGLDNDCDEDIDEDWPELGEVCYVGLGVCEDSGNFVCTLAGDGTECSAVAGLPTETPETTCDDTLDNDCDGLADTEDSDCQLE